jgi:hypothetical protein
MINQKKLFNGPEDDDAKNDDPNDEYDKDGTDAWNDQDWGSGPDGTPTDDEVSNEFSKND